jgi:nucleotide-binding universal stress UspA family protein
MTGQQRLVVPLDGSEVAEAALPYAEELAGALGASLHLITVVEREPGGLFALAPEIREQLAQGQLEGVTEYLATIARGLRGRGVVTDTETVETIAGHATEEILAAADRIAASMVVLATHGRGGLERLFLGSVADKVMRTGHQPTLLISAREDTPVRQAIQLRRIAVPLDGSPDAEAALAPAARLAAATGARLVLLRVEPLLFNTTVDRYVPDVRTIDAELERQAHQYLAEMQGRLPAGVAADIAVLRGASTRTLADYLEEKAVDLVMMTTHGRGGVHRLVLGSTADRLVRLGLPVLLIHASESPSEDRSRHHASPRPT